MLSCFVHVFCCSQALQDWSVRTFDNMRREASFAKERRYRLEALGVDFVAFEELDVRVLPLVVGVVDETAQFDTLS